MRRLICILFFVAGPAQAAAVFDFVTDSVAQDPRFSQPLDASSESFVRGMLDRLGVTIKEDEAVLQFHINLDIPPQLFVTADHGFLQASFLSGSYSSGSFTIGGPFDFRGDIALMRSGDSLSGHFENSTGLNDIVMSGDGGIWSGIFGSDETLGRHPITGHWVLVSQVPEPPTLLLLSALLILLLARRATLCR